MKHLFTLLFLLLGLSLAEAQQMVAGMTLNPQIHLAGDQKLGEGWTASVWALKAWRNGHSAKITLGHQELRGYNSSLLIKEEVLLPGSLNFLEEYANIQRLRHWYMQAAYVWRQDHAWSFELGGRVSYFAKAGGQYKRINQRVAHGQSVQLGLRGRRFDHQLRGLDLGPEIKVRYRAFDGCWLEAGLYQGLLNQWAEQDFDGPRLFITTASLGMSLQIVRIKP